MSYAVLNGQTLNVTFASSYQPGYYFPYFQPYSYFDTVNAGGVENVLDYGQTYYATVNSGGVENVMSTGVSISTVVASGGVENVASNGTAISTILTSGGTLNVGGAGYTSGQPTANSFGTIVTLGGFQNVKAGGVSSGAQIAGGDNIVSSGGTAYSSHIAGGSGSATGYEVITAGGVSNYATVGGYGVEVVASDGVANSATIGNSGLLRILADGVANSATIQSGGELDNYGAANGTILNGLEQLFSGGLDNGGVINTGGVENVHAGAAARNAVLNGGTLDVYAGGYATGVTKFNADADSHLILGDSAHFNGQLSGFGLGDRIDLQDVAYGNDTFGFTGTAASGTLTINDGAHQVALSLLGDYTGIGLTTTSNPGGESFFASSDGHGGTLIGIGYTGLTSMAPLATPQTFMR